MMMNIIMALTMYPVLLILYAVIRGEVNQKRDILFGIRILQEWKDEQEICELREHFKKQMRLTLIIFAICPIVSFWIQYTSLQYAFWMMWLLLFMAAMYLPYIRANMKLKAWKKQKQIENGETDSQQAGKVYVDMKTMGKVSQVKMGMFLPSILVCFMICIAIWVKLGRSDMRSMVYVVIVSAALTPMIYLLARAMDHMRTEVISLESEVNFQYATAKRKVWRNYWLFLSWLNTIYVAVQAVSLIKQDWFAQCYIGGAVVYGMIIAGACVWIAKKLEKIEECFSAKCEVAHDWEDERHWKLGMFYFNPNDKHIMVNKRVGIGTTVNMATGLGKGLAIFSVLCLLSLPISCIGVIVLEFTPISLSTDGEFLYAKQLKLDYKLPIEEAESITLQEQIPDMTKVTGTGMEHLEKGTFYVKGEGNCQVFLNPQNHKFISFTIGGTQYYMSGVDDEETLEVYDELMSRQ